MHWVTCTTPRHTAPHHGTIVHHTRTISCDFMSCSHCPLRPRISGAEQACLHHAAAAEQRHSFRARGMPYVTTRRAHMCIHTYTHSHTCIHMHIHNHTHIHAYIHIHIHPIILPLTLTLKPMRVFVEWVAKSVLSSRFYTNVPARHLHHQPRRP